MKITATIIDHPQGSDGWMQHRARSLNASELAVAMGLSSNMKRDELVRCKATGIPFEHSDFVEQRVFAPGHEFEALARPYAQDEMGEELYPCVLAADVDGLPLSASLDGMDLLGDVTWEHKQASDELIASLAAGVIPEEYHPQMEQGLMLSGAKRCMFSASKGTRESMRSVWYESNPDLRSKVIPTWKQLMADVAAYVPIEVLDKPVAKVATELPAVSVNVSGELVVRDNFGKFEVALRHFIDTDLIVKPETDQDFADMAEQIKALQRAEDALDAAEQQMLSQVESVDLIRRTKEMLHKLARDNRLAAQKRLDARKVAIKAEIVAEGVAKFREHIEALNARLGKPYMPSIPVDFGGVIKNLRTVESLRNAINTELARAKIAANEVADRIDANLKQLTEKATAHKFLFHDAATIVLKAADDLQALVSSRIGEHDRAEAARLEAQREQIRQEEAAKLQREADARARAEAEAASKKAAEDAAAERQAQAAITAAAAPAPEPMAAPPAPAVRLTAIPEAGVHVTTAPTASEKPTMKLGEINERLVVVSVNAEQLAKLGFTATVDKGARLYKPSDFPRICEAAAQYLYELVETAAA